LQQTSNQAPDNQEGKSDFQPEKQSEVESQVFALEESLQVGDGDSCATEQEEVPCVTDEGDAGIENVEESKYDNETEESPLCENGINKESVPQSMKSENMSCKEKTVVQSFAVPNKYLEDQGASAIERSEQDATEEIVGLIGEQSSIPSDTKGISNSPTPEDNVSSQHVTEPLDSVATGASEKEKDPKLETQEELSSPEPDTKLNAQKEIHANIGFSKVTQNKKQLSVSTSNSIQSESSSSRASTVRSLSPTFAKLRSSFDSKTKLESCSPVTASRSVPMVRNSSPRFAKFQASYGVPGVVAGGTCVPPSAAKAPGEISPNKETAKTPEPNESKPSALTIKTISTGAEVASSSDSVPVEGGRGASPKFSDLKKMWGAKGVSKASADESPANWRDNLKKRQIASPMATNSPRWGKPPTPSATVTQSPKWPRLKKTSFIEVDLQKQQEREEEHKIPANEVTEAVKSLKKTNFIEQEMNEHQRREQKHKDESTGAEEDFDGFDPVEAKIVEMGAKMNDLKVNEDSKDSLLPEDDLTEPSSSEEFDSPPYAEKKNANDAILTAPSIPRDPTKSTGQRGERGDIVELARACTDDDTEARDSVSRESADSDGTGRDSVSHESTYSPDCVSTDGKKPRTTQIIPDVEVPENFVEALDDSDLERMPMDKLSKNSASDSPQADETGLSSTSSAISAYRKARRFSKLMTKKAASQENKQISPGIQSCSNDVEVKVSEDDEYDPVSDIRNRTPSSEEVTEKETIALIRLEQQLRDANFGISSDDEDSFKNVYGDILGFRKSNSSYMEELAPGLCSETKQKDGEENLLQSMKGTASRAATMAIRARKTAQMLKDARALTKPHVFPTERIGPITVHKSVAEPTDSPPVDRVLQKLVLEQSKDPSVIHKFHADQVYNDILGEASSSSDILVRVASTFDVKEEVAANMQLKREKQEEFVANVPPNSNKVQDGRQGVCATMATATRHVDIGHDINLCSTPSADSDSPVQEIPFVLSPSNVQEYVDTYDKTAADHLSCISVLEKYKMKSKVDRKQRKRQEKDLSVSLQEFPACDEVETVDTRTETQIKMDDQILPTEFSQDEEEKEAMEAALIVHRDQGQCMDTDQCIVM